METALNKLLLILLFIPLVAYSQTTIPVPSIVGSEEHLRATEIIGDFDGDLSNDVCTWWYGQGNRLEFFTVYSYKKNAHILELSGTGYPRPDSVSYKEQFVGDIDGDNTVEIIIGDKVYSFATTGKKKHQ